ncbi:hypothetical protein [Desulfovibrio sp. UIB00]|nr:hypothetical protein [Desulfovibrio sp. UIB00]
MQADNKKLLEKGAFAFSVLPHLMECAGPAFAWQGSKQSHPVAGGFV